MCGIQAFELRQHGAEVLAVDVLLGDEVVSADRETVIDCDDVLVVDTRGCARLALESLEDIGIGPEVPADLLEHHETTEGRLARQIDDAHTALGDALENLEAAELPGSRIRATRGRSAHG